MNYIQLSSVQVGGLICLPALFVGFLLGKDLGFKSAMLSVYLANIILFILSVLVLKMTLSKRKTTVGYIESYFGLFGKKIASITYLICLLGWFSINQNLIFSELIQIFGGVLLASVFSLLAGLSTVCFVIYGIDKIERVASYAIPLMFCVLVYSICQSDLSGFNSGDFSLSMSSVIFAMNVCIGMVFDMPTFYRFSKDYKHGMISVFIVLLIAAPIVEGVGVYIGSYANEAQSMIDILYFDSLGGRVASAMFILLAGISTNNANLFSLVANTEHFQIGGKRTYVMILGVLGSLIGFVNINEVLVDYLTLINTGLIVISASTLVLYVFSGLDESINTDCQKNILIFSFVSSLPFVVATGQLTVGMAVYLLVFSTLSFINKEASHGLSI
ncbi:MAG: hypothetical protein CMF48_02760 [Legionellales bacterium]|nr:hypothetical protein [Legionellales bacterium]|tara:strand:+ start:1017 stop:2177 length:1161 start_codon:yes stop_codon:yes gene_type:complete